MSIIALFSDFSITDPYVGLMKAAIYKKVPDCKVIDICHNLPAFNPNASGRLLQMMVKDLPADAIVLAVVDPGVGTERHPLWLEIDGRHFVGPDNGLFARIVNEASKVRTHIIKFDAINVSASFHGRDVFAPLAAKLAAGGLPDTEEMDTEKLIGRDWPEESSEIIYIDHYGNAMTGISAGRVSHDAVIEIKDSKLHYARTFGDADNNQMFWYENSFGLIECSVRMGSISKILDLKIGEKVIIDF